MNKEQRIARIEDAMLTNLERLSASPDAELKELKLYAAFFLTLRAQELALRKVEITEKNIGDGDAGRTFSIEETTEGFNALLGRENAE
jgi:hypothetical protein